jgi:hypothetical protein
MFPSGNVEVITSTAYGHPYDLVHRYEIAVLVITSDMFRLS